MPCKFGTLLRRDSWEQQLWADTIKPHYCAPWHLPHSPSAACPTPAVQGDSGGPVVLPSLSGDVVVGVTSYGTSSNCTKDYAFYVRTAFHLDWLAAKMALPIPAPGSLPGSGAGTKPTLSKPAEEWLNNLP